MGQVDDVAVLKAAGLNVEVVDGYKTRSNGYALNGAGVDGVDGIMFHHTAMPKSRTGDYPSLNVVTNGRSDLQGPLSHFGVGRSGKWYVIATGGGANHAGASDGKFNWVQNGNTETLGIEVENSGVGDEPWPAAQLTSLYKGVAALLLAYKLPAARFIGHKEYAPSRKIDPYGINMDNARANVERYMTTKDDEVTSEEIRKIVREELKRALVVDKVHTPEKGDTMTAMGSLAYTHKRVIEIHEMLEKLVANVEK